MSDNRKLTTGCRIWFWFLLIGNVFSLAMLSLPIFKVLNIFARLSASASILRIDNILMTAGSAIILFKQKKIGLYCIYAGGAMGFINSLISRVNIFLAILLALFTPGISYLLAKKNADVLE